MKKDYIQYDPEFRIMVVALLESGEIASISEARKKFSIGGSMTIYKWIHSMGKQHILPKLKLRKLKDEIKYIEQSDPNLYDAIQKTLAS
ncbi:MAG: transposase [Ignavibacteriaceae bacterium]|nr:transposase [Ignavibacteriaceae bacterium]